MYKHVELRLYISKIIKRVEKGVAEVKR